MIWSRSQQTSPLRDQVVNILGSVGHRVSVTTTQLCCCGKKAAQTMYKPDYIPWLTFQYSFTKTGSDTALADCSLLTLNVHLGRKHR